MHFRFIPVVAHVLSILAFGAAGSSFSASLAAAEPERPQAAASLEPGGLRLELESAENRRTATAKKDRSQYKKDWLHACQQLAKAMSIGKGPYGYGIFTGYGCYQDGKLVVGEAQKTAWTLKVVDAATGLSLGLYREDSANADRSASDTSARRDEGRSAVAKVKLPPSQYALQFFKDDEFVDLLAYSLLDAAPVGLRILPGQVRGHPPEFRGRYWRAGTAKDFKFKVPPPPENLILYRLAWSREHRIWQSEVVGTAKLGSQSEPKLKKKDGKRVLTGGSVAYELSPEAAAALAAGPVWAQNAAGLGTQTVAVHEILEDAQIALDAAAQSGKLAAFMDGKQDLLASLLDTAASGYVGLRYGRELLPGSGQLGALLKKSSVLGLLVEVRSGLMKGLRYYYDVMPRTSESVQGAAGPLNTSISFSRHVLGYSFGYDLKWLVDRITVDPKIGIWTFNATLPVAAGTGAMEQTADFNLGRSISVGADLGLEEISDWYTLRAWYGYNTGFSQGKSGGKVTSNRFGLDAYLTAGPVLPVFGVPLKTALLAFVFVDAVNLDAGRTPTPAPGQSVISGVAYDVGYAGLGLALSW